MHSKLCIAFDLFSNAILACIKISALLFYHRIFGSHGRRSLFYALVVMSVTIVALWMVGYMIMPPIQCGSRFSALWTSRTDYHRYYRMAHPFLLSCAISDNVLDLWILALPIPQVGYCRLILPCGELTSPRRSGVCTLPERAKPHSQVNSSLPSRKLYLLLRPQSSDLLTTTRGLSAGIARRVVFIQFINVGAAPSPSRPGLCSYLSLGTIPILYPHCRLFMSGP